MEEINTVNMNGIDTTGQKGKGGVPADIEKQIKELYEIKLNVLDDGLLKVKEITGKSVLVSANTYTKINPDLNVNSTSIALGPVNDGYVGEYCIEIATPFDRDYTYSFDPKIKWPNPISFNRGTTYVISILNKVALWTSFKTVDR